MDSNWVSVGGVAWYSAGRKWLPDRCALSRSRARGTEERRAAEASRGVGLMGPKNKYSSFSFIHRFFYAFLSNFKRILIPETLKSDNLCQFILLFHIFDFTFDLKEKSHTGLLSGELSTVELPDVCSETDSVVSEVLLPVESP